MNKFHWGHKKEDEDIRKQIRIEIIKEIQETCKKCPMFKRITEKDLLYREKQR